MVLFLIGSADGRFSAISVNGPRRSRTVDIHAVKSSKFGFHLGFPRVASNGTSATRSSRALGMVSRSSSFLLEVLVKPGLGVSATGLIAMESSDSFRSLKVGLNSSLVELVEMSLPIASPVLGKVATDRSRESRLIVVWIKNIEQGWTDAH